MDRFVALASVVAILLVVPPAHAQEIPMSPEAVTPALLGTPAPNAALTTADGVETNLHAELGDDRAIVVFYRGGW